MTTPTSPKAPRPRLTREELRSRLLDTGRTLLREEGLGAGGKALTFKRVFDRLERDSGIRVTNASVIGRIWANQVDFQQEILAAIAADNHFVEVDETLAAVGLLLADLDLSSPTLRRLAMRQVCRAGGEANVEAVRRAEDWSTWIGVWALASGVPCTTGSTARTWSRSRARQGRTTAPRSGRSSPWDSKRSSSSSSRSTPTGPRDPPHHCD